MPSDIENANGSELRRVLEDRNLYAISTFTPNNQATWWSGRPQHHGRRIEYIAVNDEWKDLSAKPSTLPAVQMPGEAIDHVSVRASTLWPQFCPDGAKHDVVENGTLVVDSRPQSNAEAQRWFQHHTSACSPKLFSLAQRGLDEHSTAHSTCHQCASFCFRKQKSTPKPKKTWTSQQTVDKSSLSVFCLVLSILVLPCLTFLACAASCWHLFLNCQKCSPQEMFDVIKN